MNLSPALLLLAIAPVLPAQTSQTTAKPSSSAPHPVTAHHSSVCGVTGLPAISPKVPPVHGCPKVMYALRYVDTVIGAGPLAPVQKWYTINYTGYFPDGTIFDSSKDHGPLTFPVGAKRVITGFDTGFEGMHVGGKRRIFIPYQLAYGELGVPKRPDRPGNGIPPKQMLIFDVELLSFSDTPPQPPAGARPATPPAGARPATPPAGARPATPPTGSAPKPSSSPAQPAPANPIPSPGSAPPSASPTAKPAPSAPPSPTTPPPDPTKPTASATPPTNSKP
jgi:peptidylprolyl isomerase